MATSQLEAIPQAQDARREAIATRDVELPASANFKALKPRQKAFLDALRSTLVVENACDKAKIDQSLPYKWRKSDPNFKACWIEAIGEAVPEVELAHFRAAMGKDTLARIHILKNLDPRYREKPLEVVHTDNRQCDMVPVTALPALASSALTMMAPAITALIQAQLPKPVTQDIQADVVL